MPVSPFQRAAEEKLNQPQSTDGRSVAGSGKAKRKPKPTSKAKNRKKKIKAKYSKAREDAQLAGVIPTTPDGAVKSEYVPSSAQTGQPLSELVAKAIRQGWAVKDEVKPGLIDEMVQIVLCPDMPAKAKVTAFNALRMADQTQFERDYPEQAAKAKGNVGSKTSVNVQINTEAAAIIRGMIERGELGNIEMSDKPNGASESGLAGTMERTESSEVDKQRTCNGETHS